MKHCTASGCQWLPHKAIDIEFDQYQQLKPLNHSYAILTGKLLTCVLCHESWSASKHNSYKVGTLNTFNSFVAEFRNAI